MNAVLLLLTIAGVSAQLFQTHEFLGAQKDLQLNQHRILGAPTPILEDEVANKAYVDAAAADLSGAMNFRDISIDRAKSFFVCLPFPAVAGEWVNCSLYAQNAAEGLAGVPEDQRLMFSMISQGGQPFAALDATPTPFEYTYEDGTYKMGFKTSLVEELSLVLYYYGKPFLGGVPTSHPVVAAPIDPLTMQLGCSEHPVASGDLRWRCEVRVQDRFGNLAGVAGDVPDFAVSHTLDGNVQSVDSITFEETGLFSFSPTIVGKGSHVFTVQYGGNEQHPTPNQVDYSIVLAKLNISCPEGFTKIESQGRVLGCMTSVQEPTSLAAYDAALSCWSKYGARIPNMAEMRAASLQISMSNEWHHVDQTDRAYTTAWLNYHALFNPVTPTSSAGTYTSARIYYCFIPGGGHYSTFSCPDTTWEMLTHPFHPFPLGCAKKEVEPNATPYNAISTCHAMAKNARLPSFSEIMIAYASGAMVEPTSTYVLENYIARVYTTAYTYRTGYTRGSDGYPSVATDSSSYAYRCFIPSYDLEEAISCPSGWTLLPNTGTCMQNDIDGSALTTAATNLCWTAYGGSLPSWSELYLAETGGGGLTIGTDLTYHTNRFYTTQWYYRVVRFNGASGASDAEWGSSYAYRCVLRQ